MNVLPYSPPLIILKMKVTFCQNINKLLLTISKAASEGLGAAIQNTVQLSQLPLNIELNNALFFYSHIYFNA